MAIIKTDKFGVKEVADVTFYDIETGEPALFFESLKASNLETSAQVTTANGGKGAPPLISWDFKREAKLTLTDALMDPKAIGKITGVDTVVGVASIFKREVLIAVVDSTNTAVTLEQTAKENAANIKVYKADGTKITATSLTAKKLVFSTVDAPVGESLTVYYTFDSTATASTITIDSTKFAGYYKVVGDTVVRNARNGKDEPFQFVIEKAKLSSNFTLTMEAEGNPTAIQMELQVFRPENSTQMVHMVKY